MGCAGNQSVDTKKANTSSSLNTPSPAKPLVPQGEKAVLSAKEIEEQRIAKEKAAAAIAKAQAQTAADIDRTRNVHALCWKTGKPLPECRRLLEQHHGDLQAALASLGLTDHEENHNVGASVS
eukprot:gnl/Spiro4/3932_TR1955_c0_g1_i1.p2 gnl/Spiro4/3932_TR1955_c0_g1~~gnl/Spiro4/3932_TR1955_c0_g1_i1.p2  ORF type:complete len:123 (+),score=18.24 gnl/Spiro4/3932_TR1955_c0_g1_i1:39-407(+)